MESEYQANQEKEVKNVRRKNSEFWRHSIIFGYFFSLRK